MPSVSVLRRTYLITSERIQAESAKCPRINRIAAVHESSALGGAKGVCTLGKGSARHGIKILANTAFSSLVVRLVKSNLDEVEHDVRPGPGPV